MKYGGARYKRRSLRVLPRVKRIEETIPVGFGSLGIQGATPITFINGDPITDQQLRDFGYELAIDYGVDSANADNWAAMQNWIDTAKNLDRIGYLHYSDQPYRVSNRLFVAHRHSYQGVNGVPFEHWGFIGGRNPANPTDRTDRPVIKLIDNSAGYDNINDPKPLIMWTAPIPDGTQLPAPLYVAPDNPIDMPQYWRHGNGNLYGAYLEGVDLDLGSSNPGAGGLLMPGAQNCAVSDVHIEATGARYGFMCVNGTNFPSQNLSCNGAYIGYQNSFDEQGVGNGSGENAVNLKLTNCTIPIRHTSTACPTCITGLEVSGSSTVVEMTTSATSESLNITDARIELTGGSTAFDNSIGAGLRLMNVYISGTDDLCKFDTEPTVTGTGTWKRIKYYFGQNQHVNDGSTGYNNATTVSFIDGSAATTAPEPITEIENSVSDPGEAIRTRHGIPIHRMDDGLSFTNAATEFGAVADGSGAGNGTDNRAAIQAAIDAAEAAGHNRVFLPRGIFPVGKSPSGDYGLLLRPETKLFGIWSARITFAGINSIGTMLVAHNSWFPTTPSPMIETTNTTTGDWSISNMDVMTIQRTNGVTTRDTPPTYEWNTFIRVRSKGSLWGTHSGIGPYINWDGIVGGQPISNPRNMWHFTDNAEGKFYCPALNNPPGWNHPDFRGIKVEGTTRPIIFYGHNFEIAKGATQEHREVRWKTEFVDCSNVLVINHKHEGRAAPARYENAVNCAYIGDGAHSKDNFDWIYMFQLRGDCAGIWIGGTQHRTANPTYTNPTLLDAVVTGQTTIDQVYAEFDLGVYKLGDFSMDAMFGTPAPTYAALPIIPGGVFDGYESTITNPDARWTVLTTAALGGTFNFYAGGAWSYTRGTGTGTASFTWSLIDYDGLGNNATATHSFLVS